MKECEWKNIVLVYEMKQVGPSFSGRAFSASQTDHSLPSSHGAGAVGEGSANKIQPSGQRDGWIAPAALTTSRGSTKPHSRPLHKNLWPRISRPPKSNNETSHNKYMRHFELRLNMIRPQARTLLYIRHRLMSNIIQWNTRGIQANGEKLMILLSDFNPGVVCLYKKHS